MCGFVGIIGVEHATPALAIALQAVQHRGQDAAGVGVWSGGHIAIHKDVGLVSQAIPADVIASLGGHSGIGHVRYPTIGGGGRRDAQPFVSQRPSMVLAHNGNLMNLAELDRHLEERGMRTVSRCDAEPILLVLADELTRIRPTRHTSEDLVTALRATTAHLRGAYSVVAILEVDGRETLIAFRDPSGIRPAVYGNRHDGAWMAASESVSLDVLDFTPLGHVPPGHVMLFRAGDAPISLPISPVAPRRCIFEDIYFARPDSVMEGGRVYTTRWKMGEKLADEFSARNLVGDVVVAVPDTSRPAAMGMATRLGLPCQEGFIKNRYSGRTFIMPDQAAREATLRIKLNPIAEIFEDQRVILVDDSIVRGTTMRRIVEMVRKLKPRELHIAIFSPPVRNPCFYGIDMPSREELVAAAWSPEEVQARLAERLGADSVTFLSRAGLSEVTGTAICAACFTGDYPVPISDEERGFILHDRRPERPS
jgi:amidophosphoribosyltransferase